MEEKYTSWIIACIEIQRELYGLLCCSSQVEGNKRLSLSSCEMAVKEKILLLQLKYVQIWTVKLSKHFEF